MTQSEHVYAICCRPDGDDNVISGRHVNTIEGYIVVYFDIVSEIFQNYRFVTVKSATAAVAWTHFAVDRK